MNSDRNTLFTFFTPQYVTQHRKNEAALNHTPYAKYFTDDLEVPCDMVQALKLAPLPESSLFPPTKAGLNALFQSPYDLPVAGFGFIGNKDTGRIICSWSRHFFPGATSEMLRHGRHCFYGHRCKDRQQFLRCSQGQLCEHRSRAGLVAGRFW